MKTRLLIELAETWEVMAEYKGGGDDAARTRRETLRECADTLRMLADANVAPTPPTAREKRMEELLTSAAAIAGRCGADTAWERFAASIRDEGIGAITARTYRVLPSDREPPDDLAWEREADRITRAALGADVDRPINPQARSVDDL